MTPSEFKRKMKQIKQHLEKAEAILNNFHNGIQNEIADYHINECNLHHCTRWGIQGSDELMQDSKAFIKKVKENYDI